MPFAVSAGDNDDAVFSYESSVIIDGGAGKDTASYLRLDSGALANLSQRRGEDAFYDGRGDGIVIRAHDERLNSSDYLIYETSEYRLTFYGILSNLDDQDAIIVERPLDFFTGIRIQSSITDISGSTPEFFATGSRTGFISAFDQLNNIEVIQGSVNGDYIDLRGYSAAGSNSVSELYGFDGDDTLIADTSTVVIGGGIGDDMINVSYPWAVLSEPQNGAFAAFSSAEQTLLAARADEEISDADLTAAEAAFDAATADIQSKSIYVGGGDGRDAVDFGAEGLAALVSAHEDYRAGRSDADLLIAAVSDAFGGGFDSGLNGPSMAELLETGLADVTGTATDFVDLQDIEGIRITLSDPDLGSPTPSDELINLPYLTPALNGSGSGDPDYDRIFYAADYQRMIDDLFSETRTITTDGLPIERFTIEGFDTWDTFDTGGKTILASTIVLNSGLPVSDFGVTVTRAPDSLVTAEITNSRTTDSLELVTGQVYLVKGQTYAFSPALEANLPPEDRTTNIFVVVDENDQPISSEPMSDTGMTLPFLAENTGYYTFYWVSDLASGQSAALEVTNDLDASVVEARLLSGEGFAPIAMTGVTGAFVDELPFATRNTYVTEASVAAGVVTPQRHFDEIGGEIEATLLRSY